MKTPKLQKKLMLTAVGAGFALGIAFNAVAAPQFKVDPDVNPVTLNSFFATSIIGDSSERLIANSATTLTTAPGAIGYLNFGSFANTGPSGTTGTVFGSGLGSSYQLYLTYDLIATLTGGSLGQAGSTYNITSLNFNVYRNGDISNLTGFTPATVSTNAVVTDNGAIDTLLGFGSLLAPNPPNVAGINSALGASLNSHTTYTNTTAGNAFFVDPSPFYNMAFNAFNNTTQGVTIGTGANAGSLAIQAAGTIDFNRVPEPATLGLLGLGLLGMGASLRKRKAG